MINSEENVLKWRSEKDDGSVPEISEKTGMVKFFWYTFMSRTQWAKSRCRLCVVGCTFFI